jgi:hypothetical protein
MCYEESFFRRWAKRRAEHRQTSEAVVEQEPHKQPTSVPTTAANPKKSKQSQRELEVV